jgi:methyl-accepting chemotaxis protein
MIEERFNKFEERVDALTQSVELLAAMHRDYEARADQRTEKLVASLEKVIATMEKMSGAVERLAHIALNHEQLIEDLENGKR